MSNAAGDKLFSISELAELTTLDRATVRKRLKDVEAQGGAKGAKTYSLEAALPALIAGASAEMDEAKLRKTKAEADMREHDLAVARGEYLPIREVRDYALRFFKGLHTRLAVQYPREAAPQLAKAASADEIEEVLRRDLERVFNEVRADHTRLL